ncbi:hypothetical protein [Paenibacillus darwinianus]|nr:hypothetical protein [Paenibacillus darwinianus]
MKWFFTIAAFLTVSKVSAAHDCVTYINDSFEGNAGYWKPSLR